MSFFYFKKSIGKDFKREHNPSNMMLSEVVIAILVATLKINNRKAKDLGKNYLPTEYVVRSLRKYMFIERTLNCLIFSDKEISEEFLYTEEFEELIEALADKSLGGLEQPPENICYPDYITDTGKNLILLNALIRSHEERKIFWRQKMRRFFVNSTKQWILDQFKYCKLFLFKNSFEENSDKLPQNSEALGPYLEKLIMRSEKLRALYISDERLNGLKKGQDDGESSIPIIHTLNINFLLQGILIFEKS